MLNLFKKYQVNQSNIIFENGQSIEFNGFWPGFNAKEDFGLWPDLINQYCKKKELRILGPFWKKKDHKIYEKIALEKGKWDLYITGESRDNPTGLAKKSIGFRLPNHVNEIRFPYWQWYLDWPQFEIKPEYERFGERFSISQLMKPISLFHGNVSKESFLKKTPRAVLLTSHLKRHRLRLYRQCKLSIGCDLYGRKFKPINQTKKQLLSNYEINLCPENSVSEGYITEKIPEAFISGCIPITYCNPKDLELDFNPKAVVNLYGLSKRETQKKLNEITSDFTYYTKLRNEPLIINRPTIKPLIKLLSEC
jgi:hypothetical protein